MKLATPSRRALWAGAVGGAVVLALPLVFHVEHHFAWDVIPGFYGIYGGLGCAAIVVVSKWLGTVCLQRSEDWYGPDDAPGELER